MSNIQLSGARVRDIIGAEELELIGIEEFANRCAFSLRDGVLYTECHLQRPDGQVVKLSREVDLKPAIDYVAEQLAAWHAAQHGEEPSVAGWTDFVKKAARTVKKVAQNKTVKAIYKQAKPYIKSAVKELPGGQAALDLATKAAKTYEKAKAGSKTALEAVKQVKALATEGDPKAQFAVKVMQNTGEILKQKAAGVATPVLPQVAQLIRATSPVATTAPGYPVRSRRSLYNTGITTVSGDELELIGAQFDIVGAEHDDFEYDEYGEVVGLSWKGFKKAVKKGAGVAKWAVPGYAIHRGLKRAYGGKKAAPQKRRRGYAPGVEAPAAMSPTSRRRATPRPVVDVEYAAPSVPPGLAMRATAEEPTQTSPQLPSDEYYPEVPYEEEPYYEEDYEGGVSGWLYNRPYRDSSTMLAQMQKSPGIALSVREMYNRGLGRRPLDLESLAAAAIKEL